MEIDLSKMSGAEIHAHLTPLQIQEIITEDAVYREAKRRQEFSDEAQAKSRQGLHTAVWIHDDASEDYQVTGFSHRKSLNEMLTSSAAVSVLEIWHNGVKEKE